MTKFNRRSSRLEIMDDLSCGGEVVDQTLRELDMINHWLGGNKVTIEGVAMLLKEVPYQQEIHIADLGCGSGEMLIQVAQWARQNKRRVRLTGIDANPNIISYAEQHARNVPEITFEKYNIFSPEFKRKEFDVILATLFTHHLENVDLVSLLNTTAKQTRLGMVINDLHRHWLAYYSIRLLTRLCSRSAMVRFDAPISVLRGFKKSEWLKCLDEAGLRNFRIKWKWAFRWQLVIPNSSHVA